MKKKFLKQMGIATGVFASALFLGACGNGSGDSAETADGTEERTPVTITWRGQGDNDPLQRFLTESFAPEFEAENPDIEIVLSPIIASEGDYFARVALSMQSPDTAPDIVAQDSFQLNADASAGFLLPLDDLVNEWDEWQYFTENLKQGFTAENGGLYAIPGTSDSRGIWYNREVFAQAGLPTEWQPTSWDDILVAAEAIRDNTDATPFAMNVARSAGEAVTMQTFLMFLNGTEDPLFDFESEKWIASSQGFLDSLRFIDEVFNERDLAPALSVAMSNNFGSIVNLEKLPNAELGMSLDGFWQSGNFREGGAAELENPESVLGFAAFPTQFGQGDGTITMSGGWGWSIPANSQNHDASWRVLQALGSEANQAERVLLDGNLPVREDSAQDPRFAEAAFISTATEFLENAQFRPAREDYPQISVEIQMAVEAVASGNSTPEQAMEEFARNVVRIAGEDNVITRSFE